MMQCKTSAGKRCFMAVLAAAAMCVLMLSCAAPAYANTDRRWNTGENYVQEEDNGDGSGTGNENGGSTQENGESGGDSSGTESGTEENARGEQGFTTPGNGTLGDQVRNSGNKDFFTVRTKNNNTFYLVIDHANSSENVYMLSLIDEDDLEEFLKEGQDSKKQAAVPPVVIPETKTQTQTQTQDPAPAQQPAGMIPQYGVWIGIGAIAIIVLLIYYFAVYRPRHEEEEEETDEGLETVGDGLATESDE